MKILHTADVHFHESTLDDLVAPCEAIVEIARTQQPDQIVIAGDLTTERGIIDNRTAVAVRTWVGRLAQYAPVWVLAGNHDLTFREGQPNNLRAILADATASVLDNVQIVDSPQAHTIRDGFGRDIGIAFLPYPSVATFHAVTGSGDLGEVSDRLVDVVEGLKAETAHAAYSLLVYHGTVEGGRTGNEREPGFRTRGSDIVLPTASLGGFDAVLCGHLHHPQSIPYRGGMAVYPGCVAPLTFAERNIDPEAILWELPSEGPPLTTHLSLPVTHQRLQVEIGPDDWSEDRDAKLNLWDWVGRIDAEQDFIGARVKIKATLPKPRLVLLTPEIIESVRESFHLDRLVVEKTEHEVSKLLLEDGQDRAARVDVVEALKSYGEYVEDPAYRDNLDTIQAVGREIEHEINEDHTDPRYGFDPISLELENYKQFECCVVDFDAMPERTGVLGPTGVGKSNLILAWAALLYGANPKSEGGKAKASLASMVRRGQSSAMLRGVFRAESGTYRLTRRYKVNSKGVASSALYFEQAAKYSNGDTEWHAINEGTSRQTQTAIERVVGPESLYWLTRHLRQHGVSAVKMTSGDLADAINATLQLDFEARADAAKAMHAIAASARDAAQARRDMLDERIVPERKIDEQEAFTRDRIRDAQQAGQQDHKLIESMEADRDKLYTQRNRYEADVQRLDEKTRQREAAQRSMDEASQVVTSLEREESRLEPAPDLDALEAAADAASGRRDHAQATLAELKDRAHEREIADAKLRGALEQSHAAAASKLQASKVRHQSVTRALTDAAKAATLIDRVPCRGETWIDADQGEMEGGACELLRSAKESAAKIPGLTDDVESKRLEVEASNADCAAALDKLESFLAESRRERAEREDGVRVAEEAAARAVDEARSTVQALQSARALMSIDGDIVRRLAPARERLAMCREQRDALQVNDANHAEQRAALKEATERIERMDSELRHRREQLTRHRETIARAEADLEQLQAERLQRHQMLQEIKDLAREADTAEARRLALDYYRRAVSRDGIPSLLLDQLAPQLESRVNDILGPVGRSLKIETERQLTSGKTKTEVTLSFRSPSSGDEFVPIAELSGGEEDLANLALAAGLARVSADMSGTTLGTVILDEPCAGVSESLQSETLEVLARIGQHVRRSVIVTHRRDLAAVCDAVLEVSQNGAGSVVEVVG